MRVKWQQSKLTVRNDRNAASYMDGINYRAQLSAGDWTEPLAGGAQLTVSLIPSGGASLLEYTTSPADMVRNDTAAWIPWRYGEIDTAMSSTTEGKVTAVRARCISGTCIAECIR